jgi:hypothetical protein
MPSGCARQDLRPLHGVRRGAPRERASVNCNNGARFVCVPVSCGARRGRIVSAAGAWVRVADIGAPLPEMVDVYPFGWLESARVLVLGRDNMPKVAQWVQDDAESRPYWRSACSEQWTLPDGAVTHWAPIWRPGEGPL